jgi:hypothetical protein
MFKKEVISEVTRIKNLMGLLVESVEETNICNFYDNLDPPEGVNYFFSKDYPNMSPEKKKRLKDVVENHIREELKKTIQYYRNYYNINGDAYKKLKDNYVKTSDKDNQISILLKSLDTIKLKFIWSKEETPLEYQGKGYENAWAYTLGYIIYVNIYTFWDGTYSGKKSLETTLIHEVGHVIDNYMIYNPDIFDKPFFETNTKIDGQKDTIATGKEIHASLQVIRKLFNLGAFDKGTEIANKFEKKINDGTFKWTKGDLKINNNNLYFIQKNDKGDLIDFEGNNTNNFIDNTIYSLILKKDNKEQDENWADTTYLFANYQKYQKLSETNLTLKTPNVKVAVVDLNSIGNINYDFAMNTEQGEEPNYA